ncbi:unnamed protein product [Cuscuta epithymum]|uniref:Thioredoxin-like fold domain-containing protein n=1 Tax=Cuscuta epithymum TaxID=186058 RepID=A0AAV0ECV1_9ASTE|nr:unnamed protein product [Cuscuta epithymum]
MEKATLAVLVWGLVLLTAFVPGEGQIQIPSRLDGFWYEERAAGINSVAIEAFLDPVCPDSRDSWGPLKRTLRQYGSRLSLLVHPFSLPYHDNSFVCSRALHVVNQLNRSATYPLLESFFKHQEQFYGKSTLNSSKASVVDHVIKFAAKTVGDSLYRQLKYGFNDTKTDQATRISFKYGCVKGVYGTPFFFVNGIPLSDGGSPLEYKKWKDIIDPLLR